MLGIEEIVVMVPAPSDADPRYYNGQPVVLDLNPYGRRPW